MSLFVFLLTLYAAYFAGALVFCTFLAAVWIHVRGRRARVVAQLEQQPRIPDFVPESWELDITERRTTR